MKTNGKLSAFWPGKTTKLATTTPGAPHYKMRINAQYAVNKTSYLDITVTSWMQGTKVQRQFQLIEMELAILTDWCKNASL
jgi:hypothetical protein